MKTKPIVMTAADHTELSFAIAAAGKLSDRGQGEMKALQDELSRAEIVRPENLPADVITMNSRAALLYLAEVLKVQVQELFPPRTPGNRIHDFMEKLETTRF